MADPADLPLTHISHTHTGATRTMSSAMVASSEVEGGMRRDMRWPRAVENQTTSTPTPYKRTKGMAGRVME